MSIEHWAGWTHFHRSLSFDLTFLQFLQFCVAKSYISVWCFLKTYLLFVFVRFFLWILCFWNDFFVMNWTVQTQQCLPVVHLLPFVILNQNNFTYIHLFVLLYKKAKLLKPIYIYDNELQDENGHISNSELFEAVSQ